MDQEKIIEYIENTYSGLDILRPGPGSEPPIAIGDTFISYDPDGNLAPERKFPFVTIVTSNSAACLLASGAIALMTAVRDASRRR